MLRGITSNRIIVGAYVDRASGGICPMLAAHRNGGRTNLASFARAWDRYTGAKRPRPATRRELRTLRALLESSVTEAGVTPAGSIADAAARIRAERAESARRTGPALAHPPATRTPPVPDRIMIRRLAAPPEQEHSDEQIARGDERRAAQVP
jgi:hypothetical protein